MSVIFIVLMILMLLVFFAALLWVLLSSFFGLSDRRYNSPMSQGRRITEPACGRCGYPTRGLGSLECPECGVDLREAGILTPALVHAVGGDGVGCAWPLAWTMGLIAVGVLFNGLIAPQLPAQWVRHEWYGLILFFVSAAIWIAGLVFFSTAPKQTSKNN